MKHIKGWPPFVVAIAGVLALAALVGFFQGSHPTPVNGTNTYLSNLIVDDTKAVAGGIPIFSVNGPVTTGSAAVADAATGSAGAAVSATLPATTGKTTRLLGFSVTAGSVLVAVGGIVTVGTLVGSKTFSYNLGITVASGGFLSERFDAPVPANGVNSSITVSVPTITGGSAVAVNVWGDQV